MFQIVIPHADCDQIVIPHAECDQIVIQDPRTVFDVIAVADLEANNVEVPTFIAVHAVSLFKPCKMRKPFF